MWLIHAQLDKELLCRIHYSTTILFRASNTYGGVPIGMSETPSISLVNQIHIQMETLRE
jgi:hypothetical protein